jgi:phytoene dehydrogenase-like protein
MSNSYDIVAMGAGHNGLTAAAYLAKAGKKVLVLERKAWPGGGVVTREINGPGYWHDEHSSVHIMIQGNPMIRDDELGLQARFGLRYAYNIPYAMIFSDQSTLVAYQDLDRTCEGIARISTRDAETYRSFAASRAARWRCCRCSGPDCTRRRCRWVHSLRCWTRARTAAKCWTPCSAARCRSRTTASRATRSRSGCCAW